MGLVMLWYAKVDFMAPFQIIWMPPGGFQTSLDKANPYRLGPGFLRNRPRGAKKRRMDGATTTQSQWCLQGSG